MLEYHIMLQDFKNIFLDGVSRFPPKRDIDFIIDLVPKSTQVSNNSYIMSTLDLLELKMQLQKLLEKYTLGKVCIHRKHLSYVGKKCGTLRLCIGYRKLNKFIVKKKYAFHRANELFDQKRGEKVFLNIDLKSSYHRFRINK